MAFIPDIEFPAGSKWPLTASIPSDIVIEDYDVRVQFVERSTATNTFTFDTNPAEGEYEITIVDDELKFEFPVGGTDGKAGDYDWDMLFYSETDRKYTQKYTLRITEPVTHLP